MFTGKSVAFRGSEGREMATGLGVVLCFQEFWGTRPEMWPRKREGRFTFLLQGLGNGVHVLQLSDAYPDAICVGVGDHSGYRRCTLHAAAMRRLVAHAKARLPLADFAFQPDEGAQWCDKAAFFSQECDVVVPAALELQITAEVARGMRCKVVLEAANGPTDAEADAVLEAAGTVVIPDVLCNSGGVVVSFYEWVQNNSHSAWSKEDVLTCPRPGCAPAAPKSSRPRTRAARRTAGSASPWRISVPIRNASEHTTGVSVSVCVCVCVCKKREL